MEKKEIYKKYQKLIKLKGAKNLCQNTLKTKLGFNSRIFLEKNINEDRFNILEKEIKKTAFIGDNIDNFVDHNIQFLITNNTYRGLRHRLRLPVRGQRTRTNARTCKKNKFKIIKLFDTSKSKNSNINKK